MREVQAVIWDFDGTLVDTRQKNFNVTRALVERIKGEPPEAFEALRSLQRYEHALHRHRHWKDFHRQELEMTEDQIRLAETSWLDQQLADETAATSYDGIREVLEGLSHLPHGIVSLNATQNIVRFLERLQLQAHFKEVMGHEAVDAGRQKPLPDALVACIDRLTGSRPGRIVYVGDHESDIECVHNTNVHYANQKIPVEVIGISAVYGPLSDDSHWSAEPHFRAEHPQQILTFVTDLLAASDRPR